GALPGCATAPKWESSGYHPASARPVTRCSPCDRHYRAVTAIGWSALSELPRQLAESDGVMTVRLTTLPRLVCVTALVVAVALVASGCRASGEASTSPTSATASSASSAPSATSLAQLETTLAAAGVATVADESSTTAAVAVSGSPVLTLTAWQV